MLTSKFLKILANQNKDTKIEFHNTSKIRFSKLDLSVNFSGTYGILKTIGPSPIVKFIKFDLTIGLGPTVFIVPYISRELTDKSNKENPVLVIL
jgi:hypothetical protein